MIPPETPPRDLDLTEAVDAAAQALWTRHSNVGTWDDLHPLERLCYREQVLPLLLAAAPLIEEQVRRAVAADIATARPYAAWCASPEHLLAGWDAAIQRATHIAEGNRP